MFKRKIGARSFRRRFNLADCDMIIALTPNWSFTRGWTFTLFEAFYAPYREGNINHGWGLTIFNFTLTVTFQTGRFVIVDN